MTTVSLRNGEVRRYSLADSKNWYASYRMPGGERFQESLKTRNKATAATRAEERYDDIKWRAKYGMTQKTVSFAEAADAWLNDLEKQVAAGVRKQRNLVDYIPIADRYLKPYFAGKNVDSITTADIGKYRIWRREYWVTGPGSTIKTIRYLRGGVEVKSPVNAIHRKAPSPRTINGENVVVRGIFKHAVIQGWIVAAQIPKVDHARQTRSDPLRTSSLSAVISTAPSRRGTMRLHLCERSGGYA